MTVTAPVKRSADQKYTRVGAKLVHATRRRRGIVQAAKHIHSRDLLSSQVVRAISYALHDPVPTSTHLKIEAIREENLESTIILEGPEARSLKRATEVSKSARWGDLLYRLIQETGVVSCLEMGTSVGISAAYQAAALWANGAGQLVTLEGSASRAEWARETLNRLGLGDVATVVIGRFENTLPLALEHLEPIDWAFIDGDHHEAATLAYTEQILPYLNHRAILVYDDINWSPDMKRTWKKLSTDKRFTLTVDLRSVGIVVFDRTTTTHEEIKISYT